MEIYVIFNNFNILAAVCRSSTVNVAIDGVSDEDADALLGWIMQNNSTIEDTYYGSTSAVELFVKKSHRKQLPPAWQVNQMKLDDLLVFEADRMPIRGLVHF